MTFFDPQTWDGRYFDGSWVSTPDTAAVVSPSTGETIGRVAAATAADLDRTVDAARRAQTAWAAAPAEERALEAPIRREQRGPRVLELVRARGDRARERDEDRRAPH